ncbi:hypothetical protein B0T26DRAFT_730624, partial [Lasiosphaeria miniovina]
TDSSFPDSLSPGPDEAPPSPHSLSPEPRPETETGSPLEFLSLAQSEAGFSLELLPDAVDAPPSEQHIPSAILL